jgi:hypothetical protein
MCFKRLVLLFQNPRNWLANEVAVVDLFPIEVGSNASLSSHPAVGMVAIDARDASCVGAVRERVG